MGAGCFRVKVKSKDGKFQHLSPNINVLPSAISVEDYEDMLKELIFIRDDLVISKNSKVTINTTQEYILYEIDKTLDELDIYLNRINKNPKVNLIKTWEKKPNYSIKKMSSKTLREKILKSYSNKFTVPVYRDSLDIYENQMIKYALHSLKNKVDFYKEHYFKLQKNSYIEYKKEIDEAYSTYKWDKNKLEEYISESSKVPINKELEQEKIGFLQVIKRKTQRLNLIKADIKSKEEKWQECSLKIEKLLNIDFIKKVSLKKVNFKSSQIFANDKNYSKVFKNLMKLKENNLIYDPLGENHVFVRDTQNIYEYWCLFKMINILVNIQRWKLKKSKSIVQELNRYLNKKGSSKIEGFTVELEHSLKTFLGYEPRNIELEILFNKSLDTNIGKFRTPDFTFKFSIENESWYVYMDAKYRNYSEQGEKQWLRDIEEVAIGKYINEFEGTDHPAKASFIIHSDDKSEKFIEYGGQPIEGIRYSEIPNHRYGSVPLLPNRSFDFFMLIRMIEEYHLKLYWTCWNCGETEKITIEKKETVSGFPKYHCTCQNCGDFWVRTHCKNIGKHKLIKHLKNYHSIKDDNPWYVHCPGGCD
ncbi:MAG: DUF2357 domain-containing protein [Clostridiales bacterium]|nr:DUF2357 domain-containing protein [Clostridiales bacterium]